MAPSLNDMNKSKITGHFRVALKPQNIDIQGPSLKKLKTRHDIDQENKVVDVITIDEELDGGDQHAEVAKNQAHLRKQPQQRQPRRLTLVDQNHKQQVAVTSLQKDITNYFKPQSQSSCKSSSSDISTDSPKASTQSASTKDSVFKLGNRAVAFDDEGGLINQDYDLNQYRTPKGLHANVFDFDRFSLDNILYEPHYAWDSFRYDRQQEVKFRNRNYLSDECHQINHITALSRAKLVDWVVKMQNYFVLCHDSIYLAVKLADQYLMRKAISKQNQLLLYITTLMISAKFEARLPAVEISDLITETKNIYSREQVISFEVEVLNTLKFNMWFPLALGFLRRFAHCTRSDMKTRFLSRYILESSLLDDQMIEELESKLAAASLLLAFRMVHQLSGDSVECDSECCWSETARYYTGYSQKELYPTMRKLNNIIAQQPCRRQTSIRKKYSDKVFMSVAIMIPPLAGI